VKARTTTGSLLRGSSAGLRIANAMTAPGAPIPGENRPSNNITASPATNTAPRHQCLPPLPKSNSRLPSSASGENGVGWMLIFDYRANRAAII
jgi:hypothetical protein